MTTGRTPPGVDPAVPSAARIYDFFLGGKDNYESDRAAAQRLIDISPDVYIAIRENRAFLRRAVRHAAQAGVRQFLDIGSGLPTQGNVHDLAAAIVPDSSVVYVDNDPVVAAHGRALLTSSRNTAFVQADLRRPESVLEHRDVLALLDFDQPVAVLFAAVLHFVQDDEHPYELVTVFREATAPGSLLALSHGTVDPFPDRGDPSKQVYQRANAELALRTRPEILRFFDGYELLEPGLVYAPAWRPEVVGAYADDRVSPIRGDDVATARLEPHIEQHPEHQEQQERQERQEQRGQEGKEEQQAQQAQREEKWERSAPPWQPERSGLLAGVGRKP